MDSVITGGQCKSPTIELPQLRLGVPREYFYNNLSTEVAQNINAVLAKLTKAGVQLVDVELPDLEAVNAGVSFPVALHEAIVELTDYLKNNKIDLTLEQLFDAIASPDVKGALGSQLGPEAIPNEVYENAINHFRPMLQKIYSDAFSKYSVSAMVMPTTPLLATPIATSDETVELNGEQVPTFGAFIHNTDPSSNAGLPSLVMPSGKNPQGNPFSVMLDGPINDDCRLLQIGLAVE
jgi:mandelamide amidase